MKIESKYETGQVVYINDWFDQHARVVAVKITGPHKTISYEIEYWGAEGIKSATVYEFELSADVKSNRNIAAKYLAETEVKV
ncbi:MAG: hypothetical protein IPN23_10905 [Elusimicrobia bacterium]|nr:hypothetical protein [Elusimicrobiota bacterium]